VVAPAEKCVRAGMNDSTLMLKAAWPGAASRPALGAVVNVRLPAGDPGREIGEPGTDVLARGIIGQTFGPVTVFANAGYTFVTDDRRLDRWFLSAAATGSATDRVLVMGEVISELGVSRADDEVLGRLGQLGPLLEDAASRQAEALLADHRRVREAAEARGRYDVRALTPVDVIAVCVLLPAG